MGQLSAAFGTLIALHTAQLFAGLTNPHLFILASFQALCIKHAMTAVYRVIAEQQMGGSEAQGEGGNGK